ncbi:MAG: chemotaxis protein CheW [Proteobacteria bacterium]|nr:MAG: chemotaxis protein CheW [Pseudomonadota bacterium]
MSQQEQSPRIKCAVLRLQQGNLIVPFNLLAELVAVEQLESSTHPDIVGWVRWLNRPVPLIALEGLCGQETPLIQEVSNCLILHTTYNHDELPFIAFQVQGGLQTVDIGEDTLRDDYHANTQRCPYVARHVRISQLACLIPDLPAIEAFIADILARSGST